MSIQGKTVGFLGAGNMGEAMIKGLLEGGLIAAHAISATDVRSERLEEMARRYGIGTAESNAELVEQSDVVILAVKPQIMAIVRPQHQAVTKQADRTAVRVLRGVYNADSSHPLS